MNVDILFGKTTEHLVSLEGTKFFVHKNMVLDFLRLQKDAAIDGFDLQIISGFRDYERQLKIWNLKASGQRTLIDDQERPLEFAKLSPTEIMYAILRWSALPGCSRHHWGSDIDVFNAKTQTAEEVKLVPSECINEGPAASLHEWLDLKMSTKSAYGFFRPYATDRGGVSPERWHLSYEPVSRQCMSAFTSSLFKKNLEDSDLLLKETLLDFADEIFQRYIQNIDLP